MKFTEQQVADLSAKLDVGHVKSRQQAGRNLSYIEGWHAIAEANRIFGFDAWNRELIDLRCVVEGTRPKSNGQGENAYVAYVARVRVTVGTDLVREGVGYGEGIDSFLGQAHESAVKEAETDAMKRALMTFGNPFGLALYDKSGSQVESSPAPAKPKAEKPKAGASMEELEQQAREKGRESLLTLNLSPDQEDEFMKLCEAKGFKWYAQAVKGLAEGVDSFPALMEYVASKEGKAA